jgi:hypothetical protein
VAQWSNKVCKLWTTWDLLLGHRAANFPDLELSALEVFLASGASRGEVLWSFYV